MKIAREKITRFVTPDRVLEIVRSLLAGGAATLADLAVLTSLVSLLHWSPRDANLPALIIGGVVNFFGNRSFAFRAASGSLQKHVVGYVLVEVVALALNGILYDVFLRAVPGAAHLYWLVRLATSNVVFLCWSYPLWRRVFRVEPQPAPM
ncbi:MAG: GtrA family protein [Polyangiaceae bacterium]